METTPTVRRSALVELCCGGIDDVALAARLQVERIELNCGMASGGLTPPAGLVAHARRIFHRPIISMIRPREGGFHYSAPEFLQMLNDAELILAQHAEGIAIGFLTAEGQVDVERCRKVRALFPHATLVFHKAFDVTPDLSTALSQLIDCRFDRVLTSGGFSSAMEGAETIRALRQDAAGQIEILPGGGVRAANVMQLLQQTGCDQIHSAAREVAQDLSTRHNNHFAFGLPGQGAGSYGRASEAQLTDLLQAVQL